MADQQPLNTRVLGAGIYTESVLSHVYQRYVLGFNFPRLWRCPIETMLPFFLENFSENHLDCGVGNGFFTGEALARAGKSASSHELTLVDLGEGSLNKTRETLLRIAPEAQIRCVRADIRAPVPEELKKAQFDTITMFNLFHCVPGSLKFHQGLKHYGELLSPGGVLTGCTILGGRHVQGFLAHVTMYLYNWVGIFDNWSDTEEEVTDALNREFAEVETRLVGMVLLFKARSKKL